MRLPHPVQRFPAHWGLHRSPERQFPHASPPPMAASLGRIGSFSKGSSGRVHMRPPSSTLFRGPLWGAPPKATVAGSTCVVRT
eukprot:8337254-Pyramimonas_sp.AAC.1